MASKADREKVWDKAKKVRGKDPDKYRKDPYGNVLFKGSYGKTSEMGWEVDHITPKSKGGSDSIRNLQALSTKVNRGKGNDGRKKSRHSQTNK